jgi:hypothetical protein
MSALLHAAILLAMVTGALLALLIVLSWLISSAVAVWVVVAALRGGTPPGLLIFHVHRPDGSSETYTADRRTHTEADELYIG